MTMTRRSDYPIDWRYPSAYTPAEQRRMLHAVRRHGWRRRLGVLVADALLLLAATAMSSVFALVVYYAFVRFPK